MKKIAVYCTLFVLSIPLINGESSESWLYTRTEHFVFVFQDRDREAARELVSFCENAYARVTDYFHSYPREIHCVIVGNTDLANAASVSGPLSIVINVASPTAPWLGARTGNWLESVLIHELTHYVHLNDTRGPFAFVSALLGDEVKGFHTMFLYEGWMIEGISTSLETLFSEGGRGRNPFFEMLYKAMIIEDSLFTADQANYGSSFPPSGRIYVAGYMIVAYLMEIYGQEVFARIHRDYIAFPFLGPERAIISVTGKSTREIFADMKAHYKKVYAKEQSVSGGTLVSPPVIGNYFLPLVTGRGLLLYRHTLDKRPSIVVFDPVTHAEEVVIEADLHDESSLASDESGNFIVFSSDTYDFRSVPESVCADLFSYDGATKSVTRLTYGAHLYHPVLDRNGSRLFAVERNGSYSRLVEVDRLTGRVRLIYACDKANVYNPAVSPDGLLIAFVRNVRGMQDIYVIHTDEEGIPVEDAGEIGSFNEEKALPLFTNDLAGDYYPSFADNSTVVFSSDREGSLRLYEFSIPRNTLMRIADDPVAVLSARFLDNALVYSSYSAHGYCLKTILLADLDRTIVEIPIRESIPAPFALAELPAIESYTDLPAPLFWFPFPTLGLSTLSSPDIGLGIYTIAGSLLRTSRWDLLCSFSPIYLQPRIFFHGACNFDGPSLSIILRHDYSLMETGTPSYVQKSGCSIELGVPFVSDYYSTVSRSVAVQTGLSYLYRVEGDSPFPFAGAGYTGSLDGRNLLVAYSVLNVNASKNGSVYDFFAPWMFAASLVTESIVPVFPDEEYGFVLSLDTSVHIPSFIEHQVLSPGATAMYSIGALGDQNTDFLVSTKLDYLVPLALLDVPFLFGLSFLDASCRLFWSYAFGYSLAMGTAQPGRSMWVGAELTLTIGYGAYYSFPLIAGIKVRFDPFFEKSWSIMSDVMPYMTLSMGGLLETKGETRASFSVPWDEQ